MVTKSSVGPDQGYEWAIIGAPDRKYGWILARTPDLDENTMEESVRSSNTMGIIGTHSN